jgi:hypothetical protein
MQTQLDGNSGVVDEFLLVCTMRWMQEKIVHIIGVVYAITQAIIRKHVIVGYMQYEQYA